MVTVEDVLGAIDLIAPFRMAFAEDRVGHQVGAPDAVVSQGVVALDCSIAAIEFAKTVNAQLIVSHHPLIWDPMKRVTGIDYASSRVLKLMSGGIAHICAHTNWDAAPGGLNDFLAGQLSLAEITAFGRTGPSSQVKLVAYVPEGSAAAVIDALTSAGAGHIDGYQGCAFVSNGIGTFLPCEGSDPTIGSPGKREHVDEIRIEMVVAAPQADAAIAALKRVHPYEVPAFDLFPLIDGMGQPLGRIGSLSEPMRLDQLSRFVEERLATLCRAWGDCTPIARRVAVVGGAGDDHWELARDAGADALVTGEVRHHIALQASEERMALIEAGHFATEHPSTRSLHKKLCNAVPDVGWRLFEPKPGDAGRPLERG